MVDPQRVPIGTGAYRRTFSQGPEIRMENRFFEESPTLVEGACLLSRPGSDLFDAEGAAPYVAMFAQPGVFNGDLFIVSSDGVDGVLHRYGAGAPIEILGAEEILSEISFAASIGLYYGNLFIAFDGGLKYYSGVPFASNAGIRLGDTYPTDEVVRVGDVYYKFMGVGGSVDAGSPAGTLANPSLIYRDDADILTWNLPALVCLALAINASGLPGVDYSTALTTPNPDVRAEQPPVNREYVVGGDAITRGTIVLHPREEDVAGSTLPLGAAGDIIAFNNAEETSGAAAYEEISLGGSSGDTLEDVVVPEGVLISKVVSLGAFTLAVEKDSMRFFYIRPGKVVIEALDYESAESEPDRIVDAIRVGDLVWLFGESSMEAWYVAGAADRPIQRMSGMAFRIGAVKGTPAIVQNIVFFVGTDNLVYTINGRPQRVSNHGIEERIRLNGYEDGEMRAWSFDLDGHFFYVLSLETEGTFVYDATTQQWHHWYTDARAPLWNLVRGQMWGDRILAIDWEQEAVWELQPESMFDEGTDLITRVVTGIIPHRQRARARNSYLQVYASVGTPDDPSPAPTLSLRFSDDQGKSWEGPFTLDLLEIDAQELYFQSLGMLGAPGRVYEISDTGGLVRLDGVYAQID